jgi:hypothetical protein
MAEKKNDVIEVLTRQIKLHDKLMKLVDRIRRLPDSQRKKIEAILGGPVMDNKELDAVIKEAEKIKYQAEMKIIEHGSKTLSANTPKIKNQVD